MDSSLAEDRVGQLERDGPAVADAAVVDLGERLQDADRPAHARAGRGGQVGAEWVAPAAAVGGGADDRLAHARRGPWPARGSTWPSRCRGARCRAASMRRPRRRRRASRKSCTQQGVPQRLVQAHLGPSVGQRWRERLVPGEVGLQRRQQLVGRDVPALEDELLDGRQRVGGVGRPRRRGCRSCCTSAPRRGPRPSPGSHHQHRIIGRRRQQEPLVGVGQLADLRVRSRPPSGRRISSNVAASGQPLADGRGRPRPGTRRRRC